MEPAKRECCTNIGFSTNCRKHSNAGEGAEEGVEYIHGCKDYSANQMVAVKVHKQLAHNNATFKSIVD
jgi:hypothetical protein